MPNLQSVLETFCFYLVSLYSPLKLLYKQLKYVTNIIKEPKHTPIITIKISIFIFGLPSVTTGINEFDLVSVTISVDKAA
tara:strand:- start:206 stop:445 length:240 start_codon:yes stop_codon:yes gene_type:complete